MDPTTGILDVIATPEGLLPIPPRAAPLQIAGLVVPAPLVGAAVRWLGALLAFALALQSAQASIVYKGFDASLDTGPYAGTLFTGTFSYDNAGVTGTGTEYLGLSSFGFTLLGTQFDKADIDQGGQAILENGVLSYFTAAIFPPTPWPAPVSDIAFGFGGPGVIGYIGPGGDFGSGSYTIKAAAIAEPAPLALFGAGLLGLAFMARHRTRLFRMQHGRAVTSDSPGTLWRAALPLW